MGLREDAIAAAKKPRQCKPVEGKPWGLDGVNVLKISGVERDLYEKDVAARCDSNGRMVNPVGWTASVVVMVACDAECKKIFNPGDAKELNEGDPEALDLVFRAFQEFNGIRKVDEQEREGNSESEDGDGSSPTSHMNSTNSALAQCLSG